MSKKIAFFFFALLTLGLYGESQSIYLIKYRSPSPTDTVTYDAFVVVYENGGGFARVRRFSPVSEKEVLVEMEIQEEYARREDGSTDTSLLLYKSMNPSAKESESLVNFTPVTFLFKLNDKNNLLEPWSITISDTDRVGNPENLLSAEFMTTEKLTRDVVAPYFSKKEPFYNYLFPPKTRGSGSMTPEQKKMKLFLLVVASTYDEDIGVSCLEDGRKTIATFDSIANTLGITGSRKIIDSIYGDKFNRNNVLKAIDKITPGPNDIVIFYYSGHGFADGAEPDKMYPFLDLRDPRTLTGNAFPRLRDHTLNIDSIFTIIKNKKARFNLVLSDCCNNELFSKRIVGPPPPRRLFRGDVKFNADNVKSLFLNERKSILMTATSKYEMAAGNPSYGGFFTHFFLTSMTTYMSLANINATWNLIIRDSKKYTSTKAKQTYCALEKANGFRCNQHPVSNLDN